MRLDSEGRLNGLAPAHEPIIHLGLPAGALVAMIQRNGEYLVPNGGTEFQPGDVVLVLGEKKVLESTKQLLTT